MTNNRKSRTITNNKEKVPQMKFLENIEEVTGNQYAARGKTINDDRETIDTGSYILNALLSGSIFGGAASNGVTAFAGEEATGKTFLVLSAVKRFLNTHDDGAVIYFESEGAIDSKMLEERGIDISRVYVIPVVTIQDFRTQASKVLSEYESEKERKPMMFVLDSLGMLSTTKEVEDITSGSDKRDMTRAQLIRASFRALTLKLAVLNVPLFITNHTYTVVGSMFPQKEVAGGGGLKFAASTIVMLSKKKEKDGTDIVGNVIHAKTYKSRLSKENQQVDVRLFYESGLDRYYGLLELAERFDIIKKMGSRYILPDGRKEYAKTILKKPDEYFTDELLMQIDDAARQSFTYGQGTDTNFDDDTDTEV